MREKTKRYTLSSDLNSADTTPPRLNVAIVSLVIRKQHG